MPFEIIAENCTGCSACEKRCPTGAISGLSKKVYYIEAAMCIDCGACGVICPDDAIMNNHGEMTHVLKRAERPVAVAGEHGGLSRQSAGQRKDLRRMPALRRGLRMGRNLHHAVRPEGGVSELARLREPRGRRRLTRSRAPAEKRLSEPAAWPALFSASSRILLTIALLLFSIQTTQAADLSLGPENGPEAACTEIKTALHALADAEHDESLALDLAASGGNSTAIVEARLSVLLDRTQDLRVALRH